MHDRAKAVAEKLRVMILERGWNQSELARRSGMRPSNVSNYLRGSNVPNPTQLAKLAEALGTTPGEILNVQSELVGSRSLAVSQVTEKDGHLRLQVDQVVPAEVATQVVELLLPGISSAAEAPVADQADTEEEDMTRIRACGRSLLETLMPATPPTPIGAKQVRPLDGPPPNEEFQKTRRFG